MIKVIERAHELYIGANGFKTYGIVVQDTTDKHRWCINAYSLKNTDVKESADFLNMTIDEIL